MHKKIRNKIITVILLQTFMLSSTVYAMEFDAFENHDQYIEQNNLAAPLGIDINSFQQAFLLYTQTQKHTDIHDIKPSVDEQLARGKPRGIQRIREFWRKTQIDVYVFLLLHSENVRLRRIICKDAIKLGDERFFRLLRFHAFSRVDRSHKGKIIKRAHKALVEIYHLDQPLGDFYGIKDALFEEIFSGNVFNRDMSFDSLDRFDFRGERSLDNIMRWINSGQMVPFSKAIDKVKTLGPRRLEKLKAKGIVEDLIKATQTVTLMDRLFAKVVEEVLFLDAKDEELSQLYMNCFKNPNNGPYARKQAALLLGHVQVEDKRRIMSLLAKTGLNSPHVSIRHATIEALRTLGDIRAIPFLKKLKQNLLKNHRFDSFEKGFIDPQNEIRLIEEVIDKLQLPEIFNLYDKITARHVKNEYEIARLLKDSLELSNEEAKILLGAIAKHDLGKSLRGYYDAVIIPAKLEPGDLLLEKFRTEHAFVSNLLLETKDIKTSLKEMLLIRNHHRPDILLSDPDYIDLAGEAERRQIRKLLEILMIFDWLGGYTEVFRPPNWFDHVTLDKEDMIKKFKARYGVLNYEFSVDVEDIFSKVFENKETRAILENNTKHSPDIIAQAMKDWTGQLSYYLYVLRCRILSLNENETQACTKFLSVLNDPETESVLLLQAGKDRTKEIFLEIIDAVLRNEYIRGPVEKHLKELAHDFPGSLFVKMIAKYKETHILDEVKTVQCDIRKSDSVRLVEMAI